MQDKFSPYNANLLPVGFEYPDKYLNISAHNNLPNGFVWWFEDANTEGSKLAWELRSAYKDWFNIGDRNLIPFAQFNDDVAFFDGNDTTGNPRVIVIDLGNKKRSYELLDFDVWLCEALKESKSKKK
ncbi:hypothetical protein [Photobacterium sp. 53610]|uniref:hypothetical protein n=1 Tax=Photobacterium sp. 53610 TaxID=3102789 RepID=UPI002EDA540D